jgi:Spy/CpxP family protein refolding chaperone
MKKLILTIAFVGMGSFAMAQQTTPQDKTTKAEMQQKMQQKEQQRLEQMQKDLNLNQSQVSQIKDLQAKRKAEMMAEFDKNKGDRQAKMEQMKAKRAQMDADMKKILTPEQYTKWQADRQAKMEQRKAMMKDKKMMDKPMETATPPAN